MEKNISDTLYQRIIEEYKKIGSVKQVAENLESNTIKVRRVLITEGLWKSRSSLAVGELHAKGLNVSQIAKELCMSVKNVQSYLPYTRGSYGGEKSENAERSVEYRNRQKNAADNQAVYLERKGMEGIQTVSTDNPQIINFPEMRKKEPAYRMPSVLRLRFELAAPYLYENGNLDIEQKKKEKFLKLAKAEKGIIREVLVHGEMNLHAIHYMIQKLFGWQNSHLHSYRLSDADFDRMTDGQKLSEYLPLCGTIFRFPSGELDDLFWDDDYMEGISFKSWLRNKYRWNDGDYAVENAYIRNQMHVKELRENYGRYFKNGRDVTIPELEEKIMFEDSFNTVLEGIPVRNLFAACIPEGTTLTERERKSFQKALIEETADEIENLKSEDPEEYGAILRAMQELADLRGSILNIDKAIRYGRSAEVKKYYGKDSALVIREQKECVRELEELLAPYLSEGNPGVIPFLDELYYLYDYGDDWCVRITCMDAYTADEDYDNHCLEKFRNEEGQIIIPERIPWQQVQYVSRAGIKADDNLRELLQQVYLKHEPVCVLADGLNVLDDVGGIRGYYDFLTVINGTDQQRKEETKSWARGLGWTGRKTKPENIL